MVVYTASRIEDANYCRMRYWLKHIKHEKPAILSAYAKGIVLHDLIEHFWDRFGTPEDAAKKRGGKRYSNEKEFAKYSQGKWLGKVIENSKRGKIISWRSENEKWVIHATLPKICEPLFQALFKEEMPEFNELDFHFIFNNIEFRGRIDDVRKINGRVTIRDYKSGTPWMEQSKVNTAPQLTLYNLGLCSRCYSEEEIAKKLGLEKEIKEFMRQSNLNIAPFFEEEFFMVEAPYYRQPNVERWGKELPEIILPAKRREEHFFELLKMVEGIKKIEAGEVYPERGWKCKDCDVSYPCERELANAGKGFEYDKKGQAIFSFAMPEYIKEEPKKDKQTKFRYRFPKQTISS